MKQEEKNGHKVVVDDLENMVQVIMDSENPLKDPAVAYYTTPEIRSMSVRYTSIPSIARVLQENPNPIDKLPRQHLQLMDMLANFMLIERGVGEFCGLDKEFFFNDVEGVDQRPLLPTAVEVGYLQMQCIRQRTVYFPTEKFVRELCYDRGEELNLTIALTSHSRRYRRWYR
ncbi:MAG: hypothetical protein AABX98_02540 [Nanoarchaeota archaeon]